MDEANKPRLVDFGLSFNVQQLKAKDVVKLSFLPKYNNYAPELDYVAGIQKGMSQDDTINTIFDEKSILEDIDELFPTARGAKSAFRQFAQFNTPADNYDTAQYIVQYIRPADMWCLGFDLFSLYKLMISNSLVLSSPFYRNHHQEQMRIIEGLLHPDPRQRTTCEALLNELYSIKMSF
jgi:hypothetical protein